MPSHPILFYDGECGLCARTVQWALAHDRRATLRFAPLQGTTYGAITDPGKPTNLNTMVLLDEGTLQLRSTGALRMMQHLGGPWSTFARIALRIPRPLRDLVYNAVARHRLAWFGTADSCRIPTPAESNRFLP
jgi:predicted DCC family thiol-disulfide oxidoreductase YuxK